MTALLGALVPLLISLLGLYLDKVKADNSAKQDFLKFIQTLNRVSNGAVKMRDDYKKALEELEKKNGNSDLAV